MMDEYATHIEPLLAAVMATPGDVLELGMGHYSRAALAPVCKGLKRTLVSCDNNPHWLHLMGGGTHCLDWEIPAPLMEVQWGVVLVDSAPASSRVPLILSLMDHARVFVLHDADPQYDRIYHYSSVFPRFTHRIDWTKKHPATVILSNEPLDAVRALL
jgi:hypothetical protein